MAGQAMFDFDRQVLDNVNRLAAENPAIAQLLQGIDDPHEQLDRIIGMQRRDAPRIPPIWAFRGAAVVAALMVSYALRNIPSPTNIMFNPFSTDGGFNNPFQNIFDPIQNVFDFGPPPPITDAQAAEEAANTGGQAAFQQNSAAHTNILTPDQQAAIRSQFLKEVMAQRNIDRKQDEINGIITDINKQKALTLEAQRDEWLARAQSLRQDLASRKVNVKSSYELKTAGLVNIPYYSIRVQQ